MQWLPLALVLPCHVKMSSVIRWCYPFICHYCCHIGGGLPHCSSVIAIFLLTFAFELISLKVGAFISIWPCIYSASSRSQHTLFTLCHSRQTIIITQSHSSILPTCFTSSLEPAPYITQNSSSELFIPLSATFIWTCRFNLLHSAITFHHFLTVSLWA